VIQRWWYLDLLSEKERLSNQSAAAIQDMTKGRITRQIYQAKMKWQHDAARNGERVWRGQAARIMTNKQQEELIQRSMDAEKPKRTPLHLRRYSTYGLNNNIASTAKAQGLKKRGARMRRRSSDAMINMDDGYVASTGDGRDKNDSIASTLMSLTIQTNAMTETLPKNWVHRGATNPPSWPSPRRVVPTNCWCATATRSPNKVANTRRRKPIERRITNPLLPNRKITGCIAQEWVNETQGQGGGMRNQGRGRGGMAMGNLMLSILGRGGGEGDMFIASSHGKKMEERKQWVREEEEQTMRHEVKEEGRREREGWVGKWWPMLCISRPGWPVAIPICGVPRCPQYCGYVSPLQLLLPFGRIRKTRAMSAPQKTFFGIWIITNVLFIYLVS
jgi:hypothetical protein